jgi:hypothetical protein
MQTDDENVAAHLAAALIHSSKVGLGDVFEKRSRRMK